MQSLKLEDMLRKGKRQKKKANNFADRIRTDLKVTGYFTDTYGPQMRV